MSDTLAQLKQLINAFEKVQASYAEQGAQDTEPDGVFQVRLKRAAKGKSFSIPDTPDSWELFSDTPGAEEAAHALANACKAVTDFIGNVPARELQPVLKYLEGYCWRV